MLRVCYSPISVWGDVNTHTTDAVNHAAVAVENHVTNHEDTAMTAMSAIRVGKVSTNLVRQYAGSLPATNSYTKSNWIEKEIDA
jgi:hypothetical protein